ncbi:hypothetical protein B0H14DRAFT_3465341 [Mycena olivaceomarginata]|nr:hypothetical protein B0H14DRAFT_3465341 [Mycena olivaceomarginata]
MPSLIDFSTPKAQDDWVHVPSGESSIQSEHVCDNAQAWVELARALRWGTIDSSGSGGWGTGGGWGSPGVPSHASQRRELADNWAALEWPNDEADPDPDTTREWGIGSGGEESHAE